MIMNKDYYLTCTIINKQLITIHFGISCYDPDAKDSIKNFDDRFKEIQYRFEMLPEVKTYHDVLPCLDEASKIEYLISSLESYLNNRLTQGVTIRVELAVTAVKDALIHLRDINKDYVYGIMINLPDYPTLDVPNEAGDFHRDDNVDNINCK